MTSMAFVIVVLVLISIGLIAVYSSIRVVNEGEVEVLVIFGQVKAVLHPGLNIVPPFVSNTYKVNPRTMTMDKSTEEIKVPSRFEEAVQEVAGQERGQELQDQSIDRIESESNQTQVEATSYQRLASMLGKALFVFGGLGMAVPIAMLSHILKFQGFEPFNRYQVRWLFPEATFVHVVSSAILFLSMMILGEYITKTYGN